MQLIRSRKRTAPKEPVIGSTLNASPGRADHPHLRIEDHHAIPNGTPPLALIDDASDDHGRGRSPRRDPHCPLNTSRNISHSTLRWAWN